tara:strand:+ start:3640 stop:4212 length:573 start_codon:yes stop_codon:yes gene_type:complete
MTKIPTVAVRRTEPITEPFEGHAHNVSFVSVAKMVINAHEFDVDRHRTCRVIKQVSSNGHKVHYRAPSGTPTLLKSDGKKGHVTVWEPVEIDVDEMSVKSVREFVEDGAAPFEIEQLALAEAHGRRRPGVFRALAGGLVQIWEHSDKWPPHEEGRRRIARAEARKALKRLGLPQADLATLLAETLRPREN